MRSSFFRLLSIITAVLVTMAPNAVTACEGDCIVGITTAWVTNYTIPLHAVLANIANVLVTKVVPERSPSPPPVTILYPVWFAYRERAYAALEHAIFPSFFHGKCQRPNPDKPDGPPVNPPGCPNPDCPVVCGTPGSLVHFFPQLKHIAYNQTKIMLDEYTNPKSKVFKEVLKNLLEDVEKAKPQKGRRSWMGVPVSIRGTKVRRSDEKKLEVILQQQMSQVESDLEELCGGFDLPNCSWETGMKEYILSFP